MRRTLYCLAMTVFLAVSCTQEDTSFLYSGEYFIGKETSVIRNSGPVSNPETVFSDSSVELFVLTENGCSFVLHNLIVGQPDVEVTGSTETIYCEEAENKEALVFSGKKETDDRTVEVNGIIRDTVLTQLYINESINSDIVGKWKIDRIAVDFKGHTETNATINGLLDELRESIPQESFIEFTSYGYVCSDNVNMENIMEYYLRPKKKLLNFHVNKSVADIFIQSLDQELVKTLKMLGLSNILNANQSLSMPAFYSVSNGFLTLSTDQSLTDFYISLMQEALNAIGSGLENMSYEEIVEILGDSLLGSLITEENFPKYREAFSEIISILSGGQEEYSLSVLMSPFN